MLTKPAKVQTTINVLGACITRDIFNEKSDRTDIKVATYVAKQSPFLIFQQPLSGIQIDEDDVGQYRVSLHPDAKPYRKLGHSFGVRSVKLIANGQCAEQLLSKKGDWIIFDTYYSYYPSPSKIIRLKKQESTDNYLIQGDYANLTSKVIQSTGRYSDVSAEKYEACVNVDLYLEQLCTFLIDNWGDHVILLNVRPASFFDNGSDADLEPVDNEEMIIQNNAVIEKILKRLKCHYIDIPLQTIKRDSVPVHFTHFFVEYLRKMVDQIILQDDKSQIDEIIANFKTDYMDYYSKKKLDGFCTYNYISKGIKNNSILSDLCWSLTNQLLSVNDKYGYAAQAILYRNGIGCNKDLEESAKYMRMANIENSFVIELSDILFEINTLDSLSERVQLLNDAGRLKNQKALFTLQNAYHLGKGVEIDLDKQIEYMEKANYAHNYDSELATLLQEKNTPESITKSIDILKESIRTGDKKSIDLLSKSYFYGIGVEQNSDMAISLMRQATQGGAYCSNLFDLFWKLNDEKYYEDMINIANYGIENGSFGCVARLARAYYFGRGVDKNLVKSKELFLIADANGVKWVKKYLNRQDLRNLPIAK